MKKILLFVFISIFLTFYSCDDSGVIPGYNPPGQINFNITGLKTIDRNIVGLYNAWLYFDTLTPTIVNLGKFNADANGILVDTNGNSMAFSLGADTDRIDHLKFCLITIEPPGSPGNIPTGPKLIADSFAVNGPNMTASNLLIDDPNALGSVGYTLIDNTRNCYYMLHTTTTNSGSCYLGLWFSDTLNNSQIIPSLTLNTSDNWIYEAWVIHNLTATPYSMGRFLGGGSVDDDGAGLCAGADPPIYSTPGQEWVISGTCNDPPIPNLSNGEYGVFITMQPAYLPPGSPPFYLKVYSQNLIDMTIGCRRNDNVFNNSGILPRGNISISR